MRLAFTEGKWQVLPIIILMALLGWFRPVLVLIPMALLVFLFYFFRDPHREPAENSKLLLSPADGTVTKIQRVNCDYVGTDVWEVSIFMSPFNVHVNRSPIAGLIEKVEHRPGKFLPAMNPEAPMVNEKNIFWIKGAHKIRITQIAGILARRTVNWVSGGEAVSQGSKIGMIKFSSCTQIVFPADFKVLVEVGDKVKAGLTAVGEEE